ncbi:CU044_5270 family protein [Streptomyces sp. NPDC000983]|uniref:CU044_5270 family protein n=1 Tax=Streptomyces sp. NPDC000983 TaxID=3154373 RepID=UPI003317D0D7
MTDHDRRTDASADARTRADIAELARLLPPPARQALPHEQHLLHKEKLMRQIDRDTDRQAARQTARLADRDQAAVTRPRPARRLPRPALLLPVTALALAGLITAGVTLTPDDHTPPTATSPWTAQPAAALLDQISVAAGKGDTLTVRADQFAYTRAKVRGADLTSGKAVVGPLVESETWLAQEPGPLRKLGLRAENGETFALNAELGDTDGTPAGFGRPTYQWLSSLPSDPDDLLTYLYAETPAVDGQERDQAVFDRIGGLLGELMPPRTAAALYRAAARIPGVTEAPAARDAVGRHGVGIARDDTTFHTRTEWVFDRDDLTFLGARSYLTQDTSYGRKGTLMSGTAILAHAVVDKAGLHPTTTRES